MKRTNEYRTFPGEKIKNNDHDFRYKVAAEIRTALRQEYGYGRSSDKKIAQKINRETRAIKNWILGFNMPDSEHLVVLMQSSDAVLAAVLNLANRAYLVPHISSRNCTQEIVSSDAAARQGGRIYSAESCTINVSVALNDAGKLNQRQLWFLGLLQHGQYIQPDAIVTQWGVSIRTARTDVSGLMENSLIRFVGARKTGRYVLK